MDSIAQEAQRLSLLFGYGIVNATDVIAWADSQLVAIDKPPEALIDLSTVPADRTEDIITHVNRLSLGTDFWSAMRSALLQIRAYMVSHPSEAERIASLLYSTAMGEEVPEDMWFFCYFDDAFDLAKSGTYGSRETVYKEFMAELSRF